MNGASPIRIRIARPADRAAALALAPRLLVGAAPWLDRDAFLAAARGWIAASLDGIGPNRAVFVAEGARGAVVGLVSVARQPHFTGEPQAYIGELAVAEAAEGAGVGRLLLDAAERWAGERVLGAIALDTGSANARARGFYARLGYAEESVKLAKVLPVPPKVDGV